jgi:nicotinamidase-related amidase
MPLIDAATSALLAIDLQARLMPAIFEAEAVTNNARRLVAAARLLDVPLLVTEQNPDRLGATVPELDIGDARRISKMCFDSGKVADFAPGLPERPALIVMGCEAHVCVLQTVLGLRATGRSVYVVRDAVGSRRVENRDAALVRMERHGAELVTSEMVLFEWLGTAEHPRFRELMALIK